jgi:hypothetical protein
VTDTSLKRMTLSLAFVGALIIVVTVLANLNARAAARLPEFVKAAPRINDWPIHQRLPIG